MANTNLAYRLNAYPAFEPERERERGYDRRGDVRAVRTGTRQSTSNDTQASLLVTAAKLAAVVLVLVAALSFARIALTNAAVTTMIESDALSAQIATARSSGVSLEMEQSVLSSKSALTSAVKRLGMGAPATIGSITLDPDVVALDADGNLSLSGSVKNVVGTQR